MGYTASTVHGIEVPDSAEANNVPEDIGKVVTALEAGSIVKRLTSAQIAALTSPQKPAGLYVHNTTTGKLMVSDGTNVNNVDTVVYAIGVRTSVLTTTGFGTVITVTYTAETDPGSILASGVVTVPSAGVYAVSGSINFDADCTATLSVVHQSSAVASVNENATPGASGPYSSLAVSTVVVCAASDTIKLEAQNTHASAGLDIRTARFTVHRIGS
jgi:hypothetical protein